MSLFFITEHGGIIMGYVLAQILQARWYWGFIIQACAMVITGLVFLSIPKVYFEKSVFKREEDG